MTENTTKQKSQNWLKNKQEKKKKLKKTSMMTMTMKNMTFDDKKEMKTKFKL